jgi:hypothetical protein
MQIDTNYKLGTKRFVEERQLRDETGFDLDGKRLSHISLRRRNAVAVFLSERIAS